MHWTQIAAAILSAFAALCSATAAVLMYLVHRHNLRSAHRPEIVLAGWERFSDGEGDNRKDIVQFRTIKNIGKGVAYRVMIAVKVQSKTGPAAVMTDFYTQLLPSNDKVDSLNKITLNWKHVPPTPGGSQMFLLPIKIICFDALERRHDSLVELFIPHSPQSTVHSFKLAPGIYEMNRDDSSSDMLWFKFKRLFKRTKD